MLIPNTDAASADMFHPPVNRSMRVLDRSFFRKKVHLTAACVLNNQDITRCRSYLGSDLLQVDRLTSVRTDPTDAAQRNGNGRKCLLLRPEIKPNDGSTWGEKVLELVQRNQVTVAPFDLDLTYEYWTYHDIMSAIIPQEEQDELPTGFSVIGHVAHLNLREQYLPYKHLIAAVLMDKNHHVRTVINKIDVVGTQNEYRTFDYELLAGESNMNVEVKEEDCLFRFDYSKVYWNSRLNTEHRRLVEMFQPGEAVCDVMAGIGPFAIPAGKKGVFVWANDLNPDSFASLRHAVLINKVSPFVRPFNEDGRAFIVSSAKKLMKSDRFVKAKQKVRRSSRPADMHQEGAKSVMPNLIVQPKTFSHYVMNLPATAVAFLDAFIGLYQGHEALFYPHTSTKLPLIHVYCFAKKADDNREEAIKICKEISERIEHPVVLGDPEVSVWDVRDVAPQKRMFCASFRLPPEVAFRSPSCRLSGDLGRSAGRFPGVGPLGLLEHVPRQRKTWSATTVIFHDAVTIEPSEALHNLTSAPTMTEPARGIPVKALDGSKQPADGGLSSADRPVDSVSLKEDLPIRTENLSAASSKKVSNPSGQILTGRQEHYLKRELISQQVTFEISELASTTALQRFGAPFRSDYGEVAPVDSDLPILRYIFVHHVRNFPFLDQAREKEFWQDKLQVFLESFANKHISSSEDRLEETKRRKLAIKAQKLVELMMVSGIPTASGYEERIRFSELEVVDRGANDQGLLVNIPEGHAINGWDVNIAGVRTTSVKRTVRYHQHAEFVLRVKRAGEPDFYVGRRYGEFVRLHKRLRTELPGKLLPPLPRKNKSSTSSTFLGFGGDDDDASSMSSVSTSGPQGDESGSLRGLVGKNHRHSASVASLASAQSGRSPRMSGEYQRETVLLYREDQRVSLRAFLRTFLQKQQIAESKAMSEFLTGHPIKLNQEEMRDIERRREMDKKRIEEQQKFYEIARQRAKELDVYMEKFRRDIVESNGLTKLFAEIRQKEKIEDLSLEYKKFAEWLRIEVAATVYHLFLAEDNSPELLAQAKRVHSMLPYTALKQVIRFANPALVMTGVLDLFLAQPFGARSLAQRVFSFALNDGIKSFEKSIAALKLKINDDVLCDKLKRFTDSEESTKNTIRNEAAVEDIDLIVAILRSEMIAPELTPEQIGKVFNAYVAWNSAVENVDKEMKQGAQLFAYFKQILKMYTRQRDKAMMLSVIEEPVTLQLFRDLFTIFYEPLIRVYKSANVYNSVTDFSDFADDMFTVVEKAQHQDVSADPNQTVQSFIDLCARHEHNFYKFVHEVHVHDNGLFGQLMGWLEGILEFLRHGPKGGKLDMNALFQGAVDMSQIDKDVAIKEINDLIKWQEERKKWHQDKTRQKMAADGSLQGGESAPGSASFKSSDFGLNECDLQELDYDESGSEDESSNDEDLDPIAAERKRRARKQDYLRRSAGEPQKPPVKEVLKLQPSFLAMLRMVLAG